MDKQFGEKIYIIHESGDFLWNKAYASFELALFAVVERIHTENQTYIAMLSCEGSADLPGRMEDDYTKKDACRSVLVANINNYEVKIFIKEIELIH
jgi:hypothetical protein